jgi:alpha-glucosidase
MVDADFSSIALSVSDPQGAMPGRDRLVARTPMQWSSGRFAGFSDTEPWVPLASDDRAVTVEAQRADARSMLSLFRSLIELRRRTPALTVGTFTSLLAPEDVFSYERAHPSGSVEVHLNFGGVPKEIDLRGSGAVLLSTADPAPSGREKLKLRPYEGVIVRVGTA